MGKLRDGVFADNDRE